MLSLITVLNSIKMAYEGKRVFEKGQKKKMKSSNN